MYLFIIVLVSRVVLFFFFQAEDGIRDLVRSRGLGDVYKRQVEHKLETLQPEKLKDAKFLDDLKALKADLQVVVAFRMLPESVWSLSLIHISEPTRPYSISYAVFCLKKNHTQTLTLYPFFSSHINQHT